MAKYIFTLDYSCRKYEQEFRAKDAIDAWRQFGEWVGGFVECGDFFLQSVSIRLAFDSIMYGGEELTER